MGALSIGIAGCGPAGLAAAILLEQQGHRVTIYDQFDEPRPIGSGLMIQPTGLAVLDRLGLAEETLKRGARIDGLEGFELGGRRVLDAGYDKLGLPDAFGVGIHRASLFTMLYERAQDRSIPVVTGHAVTGTRLERGGRRLTFAARPASAPFDLVVDASGWQTVFDDARGQAKGGVLPFGALWASVPTRWQDPFAGNLLEQRYDRAKRMVGVLPIGRRKGEDEDEVAFFWSLKGSDLAGWLDRDFDDWKDEVRALWPETAVVLDRLERRDQLTFARYAHRSLKRPVAERMIAIGDAWHSASPQLGQGANMALLDAWSLARGLEAGRTLEEKLRLALRWRRGHVWLYQQVTRAFTPLYQSDAEWHAALRDHCVAPLSRIWPVSRVQATLMSGLFGWPLGPLGLTVRA